MTWGAYSDFGFVQGFVLDKRLIEAIDLSLTAGNFQRRK
jgi:hypothetical protein